MNPDSTCKLLKYLVQGIIIYLLLKFVPKEPMNDKDILLIAAIVVLSWGVLENIYSIYFSPKSGSPMSEAQCNTYCAKPKEKEHMGNLSVDSIKSALQNIASTTSSALAPQVAPQVVPVVETPNQMKNSNEIKPVQNMDYNNVPMSDDSGSFESGYSFLPPEKWYPVSPHPPVCVTEKKCPVCPVSTGGTYVDLKEWDQSRKISSPDQINVQRVEEKLNSGR
jgi:hypothetical protein